MHRRANKWTLQKGIPPDWKRLVSGETDLVRLYKVDEDPGESKDLSAENPEIADRWSSTYSLFGLLDKRMDNFSILYHERAG